MKSTTINWACLASLVAKGIRFTTDELAVLKLTGVAPFREVDVAPYIVDTWPEPETACLSPPPNVAGPDSWSVDPPALRRHHYTAIVEKGVAFAKGTVLSPDGGHITGATHKVSDSKQRRRKLIARGTAVTPYRPFPRIEHVDRPVLVMTRTGQTVYFHWLLDCLPRLMRVLAEVGPEMFIYADQTLPFQRDSLALLGISAERIIDASRIPVLTARRLIVPCHQFVGGCLLPQWAVDALRELIEPALAVTPPEKRVPGRRLYISRNDATYRRVLNEEEIFELLSAHGFEMLHLSHLNFTEQIAAFASAEIIVSPHGSGLANVVFCQPGTQLIELFPRSNISIFHALCASAGVKYGYIKSFDGNTDAEWNGFTDFVVNPNSVKEFLDNYFG